MLNLLAWLRLRHAAFVLLVGYFAQGYSAIVSVAFAPYILNTIGPEAYGLVGLFLIAHAWFQLLDAGLTPAMTRESARYSGGAVSAQALKQSIKGLEGLVLLSTIPVIVLAFYISDILAVQWVRREALTIAEIALCIELMVGILALRWIAGVRRGLLVGFERHLTIYAVNTLIATLRFPGIFAFFLFITPSATAYFVYQIGISLFECLLLWLLSGHLVPAVRTDGLISSIKSLRNIARFALSHCFLSLLWILISQTDKLLLSKYLTLSQFGYFTLALTAASGVNLIVLPISQMLMPRLSSLSAAGDESALLSTYRRASRVAVILFCGVTVLFVFFSTETMLAWTGDKAVAAMLGPVLAWYSLGNAAMSLGAFAYYIQYAAGQLRMHTWGTAGFLLTLVPTLLIVVPRYGMQGAAITWAVFWIVYLFTWVTVTHRVFLNGKHWQWLFHDVLRMVIPVGGLGLVIRLFVPLPDDRLMLALALAGIGAAALGLAFICSGLVPVSKMSLGLFRNRLPVVPD